MNDSPRTKALSYLEMLDEKTMRLAWGKVSEGHRTRLVTAAIIFGRRFESRVPESSEPTREDEIQRLLMRIMNDVIRDLSDTEDISEEDATNFLADIGVRDKVFEMDEVIEAYENGVSHESLDSLLREAVEGRRERQRANPLFSASTGRLWRRRKPRRRRR